MQPQAWRFELANARIWQDDKTPGPWTDWRWHLSETPPNAGEAMRNVTPLYSISFNPCLVELRGASEADGFRIEAAVQFGFEHTADDCLRFACTESQLIAFAKACERKGMADVRAQLRKLESALDAAGVAGSTSASLMSGSISAVADGLDTQIAVIDAKLAPILETERQRFLCAGCEPAPVTGPDLCAGGFPITADACEKCGATMDDLCGRSLPCS